MHDGNEVSKITKTIIITITIILISNISMSIITKRRLSVQLDAGSDHHHYNKKTSSTIITNIIMIIISITMLIILISNNSISMFTRRRPSVQLAPGSDHHLHEGYEL